MSSNIIFTFDDSGEATFPAGDMVLATGRAPEPPLPTSMSRMEAIRYIKGLSASVANEFCSGAEEEARYDAELALALAALDVTPEDQAAA